MTLSDSIRTWLTNQDLHVVIYRAYKTSFFFSPLPGVIETIESHFEQICLLNRTSRNIDYDDLLTMSLEIIDIVLRFNIGNLISRGERCE